MSQLLKLFENRPQESASIENATNHSMPQLNVASNPTLVQHSQSAFSRPATARTSRKKTTNKSKSPGGGVGVSKTAFKNVGDRGARAKTRSPSAHSSRSQSGCSVCDNEKRRSRSRSGGANKSSIAHKKAKKPDFFLEELLDNTKSPTRNNPSSVNPTENKSSNFLEESLLRPTLFDKYLVF